MAGLATGWPRSRPVADLGEALDFGYPAALQKPRLCAEAPFANPLRASSGIHRFEELGTRLHLSNRTWQDHLICLGGLTTSSHTVEKSLAFRAEPNGVAEV